MAVALTPSNVNGSLADDLRRYYQLAEHQSSLSARAYLDHVVIDSRPEPMSFRLLAKPWQWCFAEAVIPALEAVSGVRPAYSGPRSFWLTLPRGHDKTSLIARLSNWCMAFSRKRVSAVAGAADREQASILAEFMEAEVGLNPWLGHRVHFRTNKVLGVRGSRLKIISADAFSSYGLKADLHICDELTHWPKRDLWDTLWSGRQKRPESVYVVITNAGLLKTWQHDVVELAKTDSDWWVYDRPGRFVTWMNEERIQSDRRLLPPGVAARVLDNRWLDPSEGSGFVTRIEAQACEDLGRSLDLQYRFSGQPGVNYFAAVDYGPKRDRTACVILHKQGDLVVVDQMEVWQGRPDAPVPVEQVEQWVERVHLAFNRPRFVIDPYNMESTIQKYQARGLAIERFTPRGGKSNYELAANLRSLIVNHALAWYPRCGEVRVHGRPHGLVDEIAEVTLKTMAYGFRIDDTVPGTYDDRIVAIGMAALHACQEAGKRPFPSGEDWF